MKILSTARREREDASHLLVNEHVGFGTFDVGVRNPLHVVVRAKKPSVGGKTKTDYEFQRVILHLAEYNFGLESRDWTPTPAKTVKK